jgi:hypothetical protein
VDEPVLDLVNHDGMDGGRVAGNVDASGFFLIDHVVAGRDPVQDPRLEAGTVAERRLVERAQAVCAVGDDAAVELADPGIFCLTQSGAILKIAELAWSAAQTEPNPVAMLPGFPGSFSWPTTLLVDVSTRFSRSLRSAPNQNPPEPSALPDDAPPAVR